MMTPENIYGEYLEFYNLTERETEKVLESIGAKNLDQIIKEYVEKSAQELSKGVADILLKLFEGILAIFGRSFDSIGFLLGAIACYKQFGEYRANEDLRPTLLEVSDTIDAYFRGLINDEKLHTELSRRGLSDDRIEIIKGVSKRLTSLDSLIRLYFKGILSREALYTEASKLGYDRERVDLEFEAKRPLLDPSEILELFRRDLITDSEALEELSKLGYDEGTRTKILKLWQKFPDADVYIRLWLREEITEEELNQRLLSLGLAGDDIDYLKRLAFYVPPPADLIRMAVREAFTPEIAEKFGQYEDFPVEFEKYARWQGISPEWAKRYWASHWDLPSLSMGYEMLHRGVITKDELELLMRAQDVMPYWRDKLIKISYNPFTRVDIRRMFQLGILDSEEVKRAYMDIGYDEWHAEKLTKFTELSIIEEERDLTKSEITQAYKNNIIDRDLAISHLKALNYSDQAIDTIIALADYQKEKELRDAKIEAIKNKFMNETITQSEAIRLLTSLALSGEEISNYIEKWVNQKKAKAVDLDLTSIKNAYKMKIITKDNFIERLKKKGYNDTDAEIIVRLTEGGK